MLVFLCLAFAALLFGMKTQPRLALDEHYCERAHTCAVNGFFVLLVFLSHVVTYVEPAGALDTAYLFFKSQLDQLVVAPSLFFSGYGILVSIREKGRAYVKRLPLHRFGKVLLQSEAAVLLFLLTDFLIGKEYSLRRVLLSFTFWESVGNSNWYLFVVLALYVLVFVSFLLAKDRLWLGALLVTALSVALVFVLHAAGKEAWWYNTLLLFSLGMWFALAKPQLDRFLESTPRWAAALLVCIALFAGAHLLRGKGFVFYELWAALFMGCIVLVMTRVRFDNAALRFFGRHVFSIFILQRIPMLVFTRIGLAQHRYVFVALCFVCTLALAVGFDWVFKLVKKKA